MFQRAAIKGSPAKPNHSLEKTDSGSRAVSSFPFLVQCSKGEESGTEGRAEGGKGFCGGDGAAGAAARGGR